MDIEVFEKSDYHAVVNISGRLDAGSSKDLREEFKSLVEKGFTELVVNMAKVQYIDSSGLGALVSGLKMARSGKGDLTLANVGPQAKVALTLTRLDSVFRIQDSIASEVEKPSSR